MYLLGAYASAVVIGVAWSSVGDRALYLAARQWVTFPAQAAVVVLGASFVIRWRPQGLRGHAWALIVAGMALNLTGSAYWLWQLDRGRPADGLSDLVYGLCFPVFALATALLYVDGGGSFRRRRVWLDALTLTLGLGTILWPFWLGPTLAAAARGPVELGIMAAFGLSAGVTALLACLLYMQVTDWTRERSIAFLLGAALANFIGDLFWVRAGGAGNAGECLGYTGAYCLANTLLAAAFVAERWRVAPVRGGRDAAVPYSALPAVAVLLAIVVLVGESARGGGTPQWVTLGIALLGAVLVAIREGSARVELHRNAHAAARAQAERRLTELIRRSADVILVVAPDDRITYVSPAAQRVLGVAPERLTGTRLAALLGSAYSARIGAVLAAGAEFECEFVHAGGERRILSIVGSDPCASATIGGVALTIRDVTDQRASDRELLDFASRERALLSNDIHEGLAQELTGIALLLKAMESRDAGPAATDTTRKALLDNLSRAITSVRRMAVTLSPLQVVKGSLDLAVRSLAEDVGQAGTIRIGVRTQLTGPPLAHAVSEQAYRIVQEAVRHASQDPACASVRIDIETVDQALRIGVASDAQAPVAAGAAGAEALRIIGHRVRRLRGTLVVDRASDGGWGLVASIPLHGEPARVRPTG